MNNSLKIVLMLILPILAAAQQTEEPSADSADDDIKEVIFLAALRPNEEAFDKAWSTYVRDNHDGLDVAATIERVIKESGDLLRQTKARGHGTTRRALSNRQLREKMQALADAAME